MKRVPAPLRHQHTSDIVGTAGHERDDVILQLDHAKFAQVRLERNLRPLLALERRRGGGCGGDEGRVSEERVWVGYEET